MIEFIVILIFIFLFTVKEYFYHYSSSLDYTQTLLGLAQRAALNTNLSDAVEGYREKLIIVYCSGCKSVESKITTDFFNTLGNNISNVQISRIDLSRNDDPLNLIRGFIHPKYLIKDSYYGNNTPGPTAVGTSSYEYLIDPSLAEYFHNHNDLNHGRSQTNQNHTCQGPDLYTNETPQGTTVNSVSDNLEYEETDEYIQNECDYFLVYKTPTIIYEIKDHAYLKFPETFPISTYPCTADDQERYQNEIQLFVKKIKFWIYYLKEFSNRLIGLYDLVKIDMNTSCRDEMIENITDTVTAKDAHYNIIGKYYDILINAYPKTENHVTRLENYETQYKRFYREKDSGRAELTLGDFNQLDYLKVNRSRIPSLSNKLLDTDPEGITIRGNKHRLINYASRTLMVYFSGYLESSTQVIPFVDNYTSTPEQFIRHIKHLVMFSNCSDNSSRLISLKHIFETKEFPFEAQTWRSYVDPSTGMVNENYGWFLITFGQPIGITEPGWKVCIPSTNQDTTNPNNFNLCFQPYPVNMFDDNTFNSRSSDLQIRRFQNIIQPSLLEFGFIKSNRSDKRLFGCEDIKGASTEGRTVPSSCTMGNCPNVDLAPKTTCT